MDGYGDLGLGGNGGAGGDGGGDEDSGGGNCRFYFPLYRQPRVRPTSHEFLY